jgi:hypothetical protein
MGSTGELILFLTPVLLVYLYVKLNDVKLSNIPPEVWSQATTTVLHVTATSPSSLQTMTVSKKTSAAL